MTMNEKTPYAKDSVEKTELGRTVTDAIYFLSCLMTMAQIRKMQSRKVMYSDFVE